jgi:hypothetical protein
LEVCEEFTALRDALLAESPDANDDAAKRCAQLRADLARAVREASAKHPNAQRTLVAKGGSAPRIGVEVRQNAWRAIDAEAFSVGRAAECDVQVGCDQTVSKLHCVVISLPDGSMLVVDAWSTSGTRVVKYLDDSKCDEFHASVPARRVVFSLAPERRVILMVGNRTNVTLGTIPGSAAARPAPGSSPEEQSSRGTEIDSDSAQRVAAEQCRASAGPSSREKAKAKAKGKAKANAKAKAGGGDTAASAQQGGAKARGRPKAKFAPKAEEEHEIPEATPVATPSRAKSSIRELQHGACVELRNLQAVANLNGRRGVVRRFLPGADRWEVEIEGIGVKRARAENLRIVQESQEY